MRDLELFIVWRGDLHKSVYARGFLTYLVTRVKMNADQIRDAVQRFMFDRFDPGQEK